METKQRKLRKENMAVIFVLWSLMCAAAMTVVLHLETQKTIVIADMPQGLTAGTVQADCDLRLEQREGGGGDISIPLPENVKAEDVIVENRYMERELWIYIRSDNTEFFEYSYVGVDLPSVLEAKYEIQPDGILLKFTMDRVQEYRSTMGDHVLEVAGGRPEDMYSYIVVIDPVGGGGDSGLCGYEYQEKELALQIAKLVQKNFASEDVKLYLTRNEDADVSAENRRALVNAVGADFYIGIGAAENPADESVYGIQCYYNDEYYRSGFGNVDLADIVTKAVTIASSNRALGLVPAEEDSILREINIPAAQLSAGYLSNGEERDLLRQEAYLEKVAEGVIDAIEEACERLSQ